MSIPRRILVEQLDELSYLMDFPAIDVGGERNSEIASFTRPKGHWTFLNLNPLSDPDILSDAADIPVEDGSYKTVTMFEVLEHVREPEKVLDEAVRILSADGRLFLSAPFMYRHHRNPEDYVRWTHEKLFLELEMRRNLVIEVLLPRGGWLSVLMSDLTMGLDMIGQCRFIGARAVGAVGSILSWSVYKSFRFWQRLDRWLANPNNSNASFHRFTTGYLVVARKLPDGVGVEARVCPDVLSEPVNEHARNAYPAGYE